MGELMYIEEVKNEEVGGHPRWVEDYPGNTGEIKLKGQNHFYCWREAQKENGYEPWVPFKDIEEWELVQWIMQSGLSQGATDKLITQCSTRYGLVTSDGICK